MEGQDKGYSLNDTDSNKILVKENTTNKKNKLFIIIGIIIIILLLLCLIILFTSSSSKGMKKILGKINCIYRIKTIEEETNIIGEIYEKKSSFGVYIDNT